MDVLLNICCSVSPIKPRLKSLDQYITEIGVLDMLFTYYVSGLPDGKCP